MKDYTIEIKTLTPIWTGDVERKRTKLRETGIIGSLRWWYEALIRGLGGSACDPTDTKCEGKNHCDACELFGCTGWSRKFRLEVPEAKVNYIPEVCIETREKRGNRYLKRKVVGLMTNNNNTIILRFIPLKEITKDEWALLNKTLEIIADYGALGAKTSQGNGVITIVENNLPYKDEAKELKLKNKGNKILFPDLSKFFFYKFQISFEKMSELIEKQVFCTHNKNHNYLQYNCEKLWRDYHFLPIAFHIRDAIRHLETNKDKRHNIFGELGRGSKVFVSHGYRINDKMVEVRIWGYDVKNDIKSKIEKKLKNFGWKIVLKW